MINVYNALEDETPFIVTDGAGGTKLSPADFAISPAGHHIKAVLTPSGKFEDAYAYKSTGLAAPNQGGQYTIQPEFPDPSDQAACNCFEFEIHVVNKGLVYNGGVQANFGTKTWRVYNYSTGAWVDTSKVLPPPAQWIAGLKIMPVYLFDYSGKIITFDSIYVNDSPIPLGMKFPAKSTSDQDKFNVAFQLDGANAPQPYALRLHRVVVTTF